MFAAAPHSARTKRRTPRLLARVQDLPASDIAGQLKESIPAFAAPFDDVTAVVIKRT